MTDPHQMTAQAHLSAAEALVVSVGQGNSTIGDPAFDLALAAAHLDCARTITVMTEADRNRQSRLDAKSQMAGIADLASRILPGRDDEP